VTQPLIIAIDGPAGSGKSSVSSEIAKRLGYVQIDTGAIYRSITLFELQNPTHIFNPEDINYQTSTESGFTRHIMNGEDVSAAIRSAEVTAAVSRVSANPEVREFAVQLQRNAAAECLKNGFGVVLEGRDIGTVVLPNADLKFFLTASIERRAERRALELNDDADAQKTKLAERDSADSEREISPLIQAQDAILVDTSELSFEDVVQMLLSHIAPKNQK
jgi:CMP/dCMP kinase